MDLDVKPPWSGGDLRRLGEALVAGRRPPSGGPTYDDVLLWYTDMCAEVSARIVVEEWESCAISPLDVTSRPKTVDTIIEKLGRMKTRLDRVQDLAGVRVDSDFLLDEQEAFAREVASKFSVPEDKFKDIRKDPHSGYRAIHLHVSLPAGRVEVQIRTRAQSAWANAYEALADVVGRGIRYGEEHDDEVIRRLVHRFHDMSDRIARNEDRLQFCAVCRETIDELMIRGGGDQDRAESVLRRVEALETRVTSQNEGHLSTLEDAERTFRSIET